MLNKDKKLKLYYSTGEVAHMIGVNDSLLRFWEKEFPQLKPKRAGRSVRQYTQEDIEQVKLIHHLVKERGMTLEGARRVLKTGKETLEQDFEILTRLKNIRQELVDMCDALDAFTYEQLDTLKENLTPPSSTPA